MTAVSRARLTGRVNIAKKTEQDEFDRFLAGEDADTDAT
jgi:hypothetical protein